MRDGTQQRYSTTSRVGVKRIYSEPSKFSTAYLAQFSNPQQACCFRAAKELELLASLRSKFVVHCYGGYFTQESGTLTCNIVMDRWPFTLAKYMTTPGRNCDLEMRVVMVGKLCRLLLFLIQQGLSHSDIKTNNILVSEAGNPVLCDFGVACSMAGWVGRDIIMDGDWTRPHTRYNVHPAARTKQATAVVDMHAFMCMFVELLYGCSSSVFRHLVKTREFSVYDARGGEVALRLPNFVANADCVLNHGQEFDCRGLMHACQRTP
jgi:serine/threonine protein kinase